MVKYTSQYCLENPVVIHCKTQEEFGIVTRIMKISSIIKDYKWNHYNKKTGVSYTYNRQNLNNKKNCCYGDIDDWSGFTIIDFETFIKDNNYKQELIINLW